MLSRSYKGIKNVSLIEASLKVVTRWYLVPTRIHKMFPSSSSLCFRGCHRPGSMLHIWWECPKLRSTWHKVFHMIFKVTEIRIPRQAAIALLNSKVPNIPKHTQQLIFFILLGVKMTIAAAWKKQAVSIRKVRNKITWIMTQEKLVSILTNSVSMYERTWEPWAKYLGIPIS